jgi:hypothetical protein
VYQESQIVQEKEGFFSEAARLAAIKDAQDWLAAHLGKRVRVSQSKRGAQYGEMKKQISSEARQEVNAAQEYTSTSSCWPLSTIGCCFDALVRAGKPQYSCTRFSNTVGKVESLYYCAVVVCELSSGQSTGIQQYSCRFEQTGFPLPNMLLRLAAFAVKANYWL